MYPSHSILLFKRQRWVFCEWIHFRVASNGSFYPKRNLLEVTGYLSCLNHRGFEPYRFEPRSTIPLEVRVPALSNGGPEVGRKPLWPPWTLISSRNPRQTNRWNLLKQGVDRPVWWVPIQGPRNFAVTTHCFRFLEGVFTREGILWSKLQIQKWPLSNKKAGWLGSAFEYRRKCAVIS